MYCTCCFVDFIDKCEESLTLNVYLTPDTEYRWVITVKLENKYEGTATADADGHLVIPVEDLPPGMLTQYSGYFKIHILDAESCTPIKFKIAGEYDCIDFSVSGGTFVKDFIGCPIEITV